MNASGLAESSHDVLEIRIGMMGLTGVFGVSSMKSPQTFNKVSFPRVALWRSLV
jgi:hypothetical protein